MRSLKVTLRQAASQLAMFCPFDCVYSLPLSPLNFPLTRLLLAVRVKGEAAGSPLLALLGTFLYRPLQKRERPGKEYGCFPFV